MKITHILPLIRKKSPNTGASLPEILLGSVLMSLVLGMAGWGLVHFLSVDQKASAKGIIQYNSNRALEFISEEIKLGRRIESDAVSALAEAPNFTLPDGAKPILVLQVPNVPQRIVYYTKPAEDIWEGPYVIKRWGPTINDQGQYETTEINNPQSWQSHVLIDSVDSTPQNSDCPTDWQTSNTDAIEGFNACVNPQEKLVKLNLATTANNQTWKEKINYQVETMAFARSTINQGFSNNQSTFTVNNKKLILEKSANVTFQVLGGDVICPSGGAALPVTTNLYVDDNQQTWNTTFPLNLTNQAAGTTFDVESIAGDGLICDGAGLAVSTANINTSQVVVLLNGDPVPDVNSFAYPNTIDLVLQEYVENGKIKLADNQAIYLFELAETDKTNSAFDLQDNMVLATVETSN